MFITKCEALSACHTIVSQAYCNFNHAPSTVLLFLLFHSFHYGDQKKCSTIITTPFLLSRSYFNFKSVLLTALLMQAFLLASVCVGVCFEGSFSGNWNVIQNSWLEKEIVFAERTLRQQSKFFFVLLQALVTSVTSRANPCWRWLSSRKRYAYYWGVCSFHLVSERC